MENLLELPRDKKSVSFPLPTDALPNIKLTAAQVREYRARASSIVGKTVELGRAHSQHDLGLVIAAGDWKLAKEKDNLRVFKRQLQTHDTPTHASNPMMLCIGTVRGSIEDTLYGFHEETTEETRAINSVLNKNHLDAAVVAVMDRGTRKDPLRLLTLKWRLNSTPGFIKSRDVFTLESMGVGEDEDGNKFGHILITSVERPDFPAFSKHIAIRSKVMVCCILRQVTPHVVGVYTKGVMNLGGDLSDRFCYSVACSRLLSILSSTKSQRSKQLTALATMNGRVFLPVEASRLGFTRVKMSSRATMRCTSIGTARTNSTDSADGSPGTERWPVMENRQIACLLCRKRGSSVPWLRSGLRTCQLCDRLVCGKCLVKRELLAVPANIQVWCCKGCMVEAKSMPIDPQALCPLLKY